MKIAIIGENYYPTVGGIQEHMYNQAKCLREGGHDARIITGIPEVGKWIGPADSPWVHRVGKSRRYGVMGTVTNYTFGPGAGRFLRRLLRVENFDLVHVHNPCDFGLPLLVYAMFRGPVVATLHSAFRDSAGRRIISPYYRYVLKRTDEIIAVSELAAASMLRYCEFDYSIIPNGVNVSFFAGGLIKPEYRHGGRTLLYLGRFEKRNGLDKLIEAFPRVLSHLPDCRLLIAGAARDGSTAEYEKLVPPHCRDRVTFLGMVDDQDRPDLYRSSDLFVLPARFGGSFSIMVLEALASGTPVVSTPFVKESLRGKHWQTVHICRDYSPGAIASMIIDTLEKDNSELVSKGREIAADFDWKIVTKQLLRVYDRVMTGRDGSRPGI